MQRHMFSKEQRHASPHKEGKDEPSNSPRGRLDQTGCVMSTDRFDLRSMTVEEFLKATNCGYAEQSFIEFASQYPSMRAVWDALAEGHGKPWWFLWLATRPALVAKKDLRAIACQIVMTVGSMKTTGALPADARSRRAIEVAERHAAGKASDEELDEAMASAGSAIAVAWSARTAIAAAGAAKEIAAADAAWHAAWYAIMEYHRSLFAGILNPFISQGEK